MPWLFCENLMCTVCQSSVSLTHRHGQEEVAGGVMVVSGGVVAKFGIQFFVSTRIFLSMGVCFCVLERVCVSCLFCVLCLCEFVFQVT